MSRGTVAKINLSNLRHNFKVLNALANNKLILVVKADAYGHGLRQIVMALEDVSCFAVATIDEALIIRKIRPSVRILLLEGFLDENELKLALKHNFESVIHQNHQLKMFENLTGKVQMRVWLKYDSGMNRLGFDDVEYGNAINSLEGNIHVKELILMSHFASAEQIDNPFNQLQKQKFLQYQKNHQISLSNSSALLNNQHVKGEWCRTGLALFGVSPILNTQSICFNLKPVMTLKTSVIAVKRVSKGNTIGYGQTFKAQSDMRIAIVGIGYGDGYPWRLSENANVLINNINAPIVGKVSMDMMAVDISQNENVKMGNPVLVWGQSRSDQLLIEDVAINAETIAYVLLCQITSRVHYHYVVE